MSWTAKGKIGGSESSRGSQKTVKMGKNLAKQGKASIVNPNGFGEGSGK